MKTAADYLHAQIFGSHTHRCESKWCKGRVWSCSDPNDCQPGPRTCPDCVFREDEESDQRRAWQQVDRVLQTAVGFSTPKEPECNADEGHPCDSGPDGEPCVSCKANEAYYHNLWENGGRQEAERERDYVQNMIDAGRSHLLRPEERL